MPLMKYKSTDVVLVLSKSEAKVILEAIHIAQNAGLCEEFSSKKEIEKFGKVTNQVMQQIQEQL